MNASAMRRNVNWRGMPLLLTVLAVTLAAASPGAAQAPAWPGDAQKNEAPGGAPAWPGERPSAPAARDQAAPIAASPPPMMAPMGPPPSMSPPGGGMSMAPAPNDKQQGCIAEFNRLRGELDKKAAIAKGIGGKGSREELCKAVTAMFAAENKWFNYAKSNSSSCGIPGDIIKQMGGGHTQIANMKTNICNAAASAGAAAAPRAPSLSEALGTSTLPDQSNTTVRRGGTLDTMTGNPIR